MIIVSGRVIDFLILVACFITFYVYVYWAERGKTFKIRKIPALEAVSEVIGRAVEQGRPVHFTSGGTGSLSDALAPQLLAGVGVLSHISKTCAELDAKLVVSEVHPDLLPLVVSTIETSYQIYGRDVPEDTVTYIPRGRTYTIGAAALIQREKVAANFMIGPFTHEAVFLAEAGSEAGAMQIAGTARVNQMPFFATVCDYILIAEDIYAAGAYIQGTPKVLGTIVGEDPFKILMFCLLIIGVILATFNVTWLMDILNM